MKKILVLEDKMELGGVCVAVSNFVENMKSDYEISLYIAKKGGELENRIPQGVKINYIGDPLSFVNKSRNECKKLGTKFLLKKLIYTALYRYLGMRKFVYKSLIKRTAVPSEEFDFVISNEMDCSKYMIGSCHTFAKAVNAKKKVLMVHADFIQNGYSQSFFEKEYIPVYDKIIVAARSQVDQMCELFPNHKDKFMCIPNFEDSAKIQAMANEFKVDFPKDVINFVSVSRLAEVKAFPRALGQIAKLKNEGYKFCWHIIGEGNQRQKIEEIINQNGLEDCVKLHGYDKNPYPYMKAADFLALLSYHEAYGLVVIESLICHTPALVTNFLSAHEIVREGEGIVCENTDDGVYLGLKQMFDNYKKYKQNVKNYYFDNEAIKEKFKELIDG